ncbi:permease-like cell division protein FtsX [Granulosicoccaceae sp. 1_MG-2023]|nr:permease-like cell division protein FtsX [Granulosicoccaceae sp. 1_MG-2023]
MAALSLKQRFAYTPRGHALRHSLAYLSRARVATLLTLLVIGISLALPAIFSVLVTNLRSLDVGNEDANSLTLYLHMRVDDLGGVELASRIQQRDDIRMTRYVSRDEALETFSRHFSLADAVDTLGENPLPGAIIAVMATEDDDEARIAALSQELSALPEVEFVKYDLRWLKRLHALLELVSRAVWLIGGLLVMTALLVIGNTIRLEMLRRSDEIAVSHLVGASRRQIRRPFLYSGLIYGFAGGLLALCLVWLSVGLLRGPTAELAGLYGSGFELSGLNGAQSGLILAISTLVGLTGAWFAVRWQITRLCNPGESS